MSRRLTGMKEVMSITQTDGNEGSDVTWHSATAGMKEVMSRGSQRLTI